MDWSTLFDNSCCTFCSWVVIGVLGIKESLNFKQFAEDNKKYIKELVENAKLEADKTLEFRAKAGSSFNEIESLKNDSLNSANCVITNTIKLQRLERSVEELAMLCGEKSLIKTPVMEDMEALIDRAKALKGKGLKS